MKDYSDKNEITENDDIPYELDRYNHGASMLPYMFCRFMKIPENELKCFIGPEGGVQDEFSFYANSLAWKYRKDYSDEVTISNLKKWNTAGIYIEIIGVLIIIIVISFLVYFANLLIDKGYVSMIINCFQSFELL